MKKIDSQTQALLTENIHTMAELFLVGEKEEKPTRKSLRNKLKEYGYDYCPVCGRKA